MVADLPPGLSLSSDQKSIAGTPTAVGSFVSTIETSNAAGSISKSMIFEIKDFSPWIYSTSIDFPGYGETDILQDFPVYLELNTSIPGFSYEQFASVHGHDLRFLTSDGMTGVGTRVESIG